MGKSELFTDRVVKQIMEIRASGKYNMFDGIGIQREAYDRGFFELVLLIEEHGEEYISFILGDHTPPLGGNGIQKITEQDLDALIGMTQNGYTIIRAREKRGGFSDSDHYGIALARSESGNYVTWQFHTEDGEISFYWGHYHTENEEAAVTDFETRE